MHGLDWLPPKLVARMSTRRGRAHAFDSLRPQWTALIVVDMTRLFTADLPDDSVVLANIDSLAKVLRHAGGAVAWVRPADPPHLELVEAVLGREPSARYRAAMMAGDERAALDDRLYPRSADLHVTKRGYSAFFPGACDLPEKLQARGIDTVLIAGAIANVCCEASARDAFARGFRAVMLADAMIGNPDEHRAALAAIYRNFGDVRSTAEAIALLGG